MLALVHPHDPVRRLDHKLQKFQQGNTTCDLPGCHATNSIGHQHSIRSFVKALRENTFTKVRQNAFKRTSKAHREVMVLIAVTNVALMRLRAKINLNATGRNSVWQLSQLRFKFRGVMITKLLIGHANSFPMWTGESQVRELRREC